MESSKFQLWRRGKVGIANCAKSVDFPRVQFSAVFFRGELITQVMSSCKLVSVTVVAFVGDADKHTLIAHTETTTTTTLRSHFGSRQVCVASFGDL